MKKLTALMCVLVCASCLSQTTVVTKTIDQYPNRVSPDPNDLFLVENNTFNAYFSQRRTDLNSQFVQQIPNQWAGPTNNVDLNVANHNNGDLYYVTYTPVSVTGFLNKLQYVQTVTMTVFNASATNVTLLIPSSCMSRDLARSYTITNGQDFIISFRWHPGLNHTNSVSCPNG